MSTDLDTRLRNVEELQARLDERIDLRTKPIDALGAEMKALTGQLAETRSELKSLKSQAVLLGAIASVASPFLFAIITWAFGHFVK